MCDTSWRAREPATEDVSRGCRLVAHSATHVTYRECTRARAVCVPGCGGAGTRPRGGGRGGGAAVWEVRGGALRASARRLVPQARHRSVDRRRLREVPHLARRLLRWQHPIFAARRALARAL